MTSPGGQGTVTPGTSLRISFETRVATAAATVDSADLDGARATIRAAQSSHGKVAGLEKVLLGLRSGTAVPDARWTVKQGGWADGGDLLLALVQQQAGPAPVKVDQADTTAVRESVRASWRRSEQWRVVERTTAAAPAPAPGPVQVHTVAKDLSARPLVMHMGFGGDREDEMVPASRALGLVANMVEIGRRAGFTVVLGCRTDDLDTVRSGVGDAAADLVTVQVEPVSPWREDPGELERTGGIGLPAIPTVPAAVGRWIEEDRKARGYRLGAETDRSLVQAAVAKTGNSVAQGGRQAELAALGQRAGLPVRHYVGHVEGGNLLTGTQHGRPFALVGRDGVAVTRKLLSRATAVATDDQVRQAVAADTGIPADRVFFVEQPGRYHLDMGMLLLGDGTVLVNDSRLVADLLLGWVRLDLDPSNHKLPAEKLAAILAEFTAELQPLRALAALEDRAVQDLTHAGLTVRRVPAVFPESLITPAMNFLNGEIGVGRQGGYLVTNGGDRRAEEMIADLYFAAAGALSAIYFVDPGLSAASLNAGGGIGCRVKSSEVAWTS